MYTINKIRSYNKPEKFYSLNNGIWYYNYEIEEEIVVTRFMGDTEDIERTRYEFAQVRINGEPTVSKCYEAILKAYINEDGTNLYDLYLLTSKLDSQCTEILRAIRVDFGLEEEDTPLAKQKRKLLEDIDNYDTSDEVNAFFLNGNKVWLDKDTRVGLMNSLNIEKNSGKELSTLWFNNMCITINCDAAMQMLSALELYALDCYNVTALHKVAVELLTDLEAALAYDYTTGYPEKISFTI